MKQIITLVFIVISCNILSSQIDFLELFDTCPYEENGSIEVELTSNAGYPEFPYFVELIGDGHDYYTSFEIFSLKFQVDNLPAGDYEFIVDMQDEVELIFCADIQERELPQIDPLVSHASGIDHGNGEVNLNPNEAYTYSWAHDPLLSSPIATNLDPGYYCVTVANDYCEIDTCLTVLLDYEEAITSLNAYVNVFPACPNGGIRGAADINVLNGYAPFTYKWSTGETTSSIHNKVAGIYKVSIVDALGNAGNYNVTIPENNICFLYTKEITHPTCGESNGSIVIGATNSDYGNYTFAWFRIENGQETLISNFHTITSLEEGTYKLLVYDALGNTLELIYVIGTENLQIDEVDSSDGNSVAGSYIIPYVSSGQKPFAYVWSGPSIDDGNISSPQQFDLLPGDYCFTVTDYDHCEQSECVQISGTCDLIGELLVSGTCPGEAYGSISVEVNEPQSLYDYEFIGSTNGVYIQQLSSSTGMVLPQGEYEIIVTSQQFNCSESRFVFVDEQYYDVTENIDEICVGEPAVISLSISGGINHTVSWSNGESGNAISIIEQGHYAYTITDDLLCSYESSVYVQELDPTITSSISVDRYTCVNNVTHARVKYLVENKAGWQYEVVPLNVEVCIRNGTESCYDEKCVTIQKDEFSLNESDIGCLDGDNMLTVPQLIGGVEPFSYEWNTGETSASIVVSIGNVYSVTVTDDTGCFREHTYNNIIESTELQSEIPLGLVDYSSPPNSNPISITVDVNGGSPSYQYQWNNGGTEKTTQYTGEGLYCVTVTDQCANHYSESCLNFEIDQDWSINSSDLFDFPVDCTGVGETITVNKYLWWWYLINVLGYETKEVELHWPNSGGVATLEIAFKEGESNKYQITEGPEFYTIGFEDIYTILPFTVVEGGKIIHVSTFEVVVPTSYVGYSGVWNVPETQSNLPVITGYTKDCAACVEDLNFGNTPSLCDNGSSYVSWEFVPVDYGNPCGNGTLIITDKYGNFTTIQIQETTNVTFFNSAPVSLLNNTDCPNVPGCLWDAQQLVDQNFAVDNFEDDLQNYQVYASICTATEESLCNEDNVLEMGIGAGFYGCFFEYTCPDNPEIQYTFYQFPTLYRAKDYEGLLEKDEWYLISTCDPCPDAPWPMEDGFLWKGGDANRIFSEKNDQEALAGSIELPCAIVPFTPLHEPTIDTRDSDNVENELIVYPMPFSSEIVVSSSYPISNYKVYTTLGDIILEKDVQASKEVKIQLSSSLPDGLYLLEINNNTSKIIIKNDL